MGQCAKATFSYAVVLNNDEIENLLEALGIEDVFELSSWLGSELLSPFSFDVQRKHEDGGIDDEDEDDAEAVISFVGRYDRKNNFEVPELEIWGRDAYAMKFKSIPMPADKEFMVSAKEAFQKLQDTEAFKEAGITELVP
ncbi:hypothetical protein C0995_008815 [Termitomyces sp. Mi166|nr:hypothetical protein C0995_008815 [Termitomyces sp. Mi166\